MLSSLTRTIPFLLASAALSGCTGTVEIAGTGTGTTGGAGGAPATATSTGGEWSTTSGGWGSTSATSGSGNPQVYGCSGPNSAPPATACTPSDPGCNPGKSACAATEVFDGAPTFALRIESLELTKPAALGTGIGKIALENWLGPVAPACQIPDYLVSWLLQFNLAAGSLTTGAAIKGVGTAGFQFINGTIDTWDTSVAILPATAAFALGDGCDLDVAVGDVNVPIQYNPGSPGNVYLPFRRLRFSGAKITPDHNCIGTYGADKLSPASGCAPPKGTSPFEGGAEIHGMMTLEEADKIVVADLQESLCVFLSQDAKTYGTTGSQFKYCTRDAASKIIFQGDFCAATNAAATPGCADAVEVSGTFAAAGVKMGD
jgi:hypothetical protein